MITVYKADNTIRATIHESADSINKALIKNK